MCSMGKAIVTGVAKRPAFLDLPIEIRLEIYSHLVQLEKADIEDGRWRDIVGDRDLSFFDGAYNPYLVSIKPQQPQNDRNEWTYDAGVLYTRDPVVWQLNRQIRREAMPTYLRDHLSVEVRGHLEHRYVSCPKQIGFRHFQHWWHGLEERTARDVRTVVVRDFVDVVYPSMTASQPCLADPFTGEDEGGSWPCELAAFQIKIGDRGRTMTISTPLRLVQMQVKAIERYLDGVSLEKSRCNEVFDGQDLYNLICWLRTCEGDEWEISSMHLDNEDVSVRFRIWGTHEEADFLDREPWFNVKKGWRHIVTTVRLAG